MSIFTKTSKHEKHNSQKRRHANPLPKLYILATAPSVASSPETAEWILDLCIPGNVENKAAKRPVGQSQRSHSYTKLFHQHKTEPATHHVADPAQEETRSPDIHYYFSRLQPDSHTEERPTDVVLQIFLTSFPSSETTQRTSVDLLIEMNKILETVFLTPVSSLWLRQALYAMQVAELIPPASHGLDISKFMSFATSYIEQHLQATGSEQSTVKEVNYSKVLRENERLKRMFNPDTTDYDTLNAANERTDELRDDEDVWNLPLRGKATKGDKSWGGFWVTHGSDRSQDQGSSEPFKRRNVYGGLM